MSTQNFSTAVPPDFVPRVQTVIARLQAMRDGAQFDAAQAFLAHVALTAPPILSALAARDVVSMVIANAGANDVTGAVRFGILNARIGWLQDKLIQHNYRGRTFNYAGMPLGGVTVFGATVVACPGCEKPAVATHPRRGAVLYVHVEEIIDWMIATPNEACLMVDEAELNADDGAAPPSTDGF